MEGFRIGSRRHTRSIALAATLALVAALPLAEAPIASADAPALTDSITISGTTTGYVEVELTEALRPLNEDSPTVTFEGGGRFIAAALRSASQWGKPLFDVFRHPDGTEWRGYSGDGDMTLHPGHYRLYLATVEPGSVTLEFPSLPDGALALAPEVHTPFVAKDLETRETDGVVRFGESHLLSGGGMALLTATVADPPLGTELELCWYDDGSEAEAGEDAYARGCPGGSTFGPRTVSSPGEGAFHLSTGGSSSDRILGLGGNVTAPLGSPGHVDAWGMWFAFDFPYSPPPPPPPPPEPEEPPPPVQGVWLSPGSAPAGTSQPTPSPLPAPAAGTATLKTRRVEVDRGRGGVELGCDTAGACRGSVALAGGEPAEFGIPPGGGGVVEVNLPRKLRRQVRRSGRERAEVLIASELGAETRQLRATVVLRRS